MVTVTKSFLSPEIFIQPGDLILANALKNYYRTATLVQIFKSVQNFTNTNAFAACSTPVYGLRLANCSSRNHVVLLCRMLAPHTNMC